MTIWNALSSQVFACAAEALERFSEFKRDRGLIDFADQEALALELLRRPEVRERLGEWFDLLMVDEFQDTVRFNWLCFWKWPKQSKSLCGSEIKSRRSLVFDRPTRLWSTL